MSWFSNLFKKDITILSGFKGSLGRYGTKKQINKGYMSNPHVYSAVNLISGACKQVPWQVYKITDEPKANKYKRLPTSAKKYNFDRVYRLKEQSMEEVSTGSLYDLLQEPNPLQGWSEYIEAAIGFKLITGNSFTHGVYADNGNNAGSILEIWNVPPRCIEILGDWGVHAIPKGYRIQNVRFDKEEVMHLKYFNPEGSFYGLSPLSSATPIVEASNTAYMAQNRSFHNAGAAGILSLQEPGSMNEEQASKLRDLYKKKYSGPENRGKIIISGAKLRWEQIGMSARDMEIIETQNMSKRDIYEIYGLKSELGNDPANKTYNNVSEASRSLYMLRALPELDSLRYELNKWLTPTHGEGLYLDYDLNAVPALQQDLADLKENVKDAWWLTGNEKRRAMNFEDKDEMEQFFIPAGLIPVNEPETDANKDNDIPGDWSSKRNGESLAVEND